MGLKVKSKWDIYRLFSYAGAARAEMRFLLQQLLLRYLLLESENRAIRQLPGRYYNYLLHFATWHRLKRVMDPRVRATQGQRPGTSDL
jgi:hypothetical protein